MKHNRLFDIYSRMPIFLQNAACSLAGVKMRHERYNNVFHDALRYLRHSQWSSLEEQQEYQNERLRLMIKHAYETVPYYQEIFEAEKITPQDIKTTKDLYKLPILGKSTVRKRFKDLHSKGWNQKRIKHGHTGGTTGTALQLISDIDTLPWQWAVWWRHRERFGLKLHDPFIVFAGRDVVPLSSMDPPVWRRNLAMHQTYLSVHHLTQKNIPVIADYLCQRKVKYYSGYPSAIYLVACYFLEKNIHLPHPPRVVVTGAETLLPYQRDVISKAFETEVADQYGASESCGNISECEKHMYHVDMEFGAVEFLPLSGMPDNTRRIVCTGFHNPAMPLIRYDIGDVATMSDTVCSCGRHSPIVEKIDGRMESYIITPDGRQLGHSNFLLKDSDWIEEAQIVQENIDSVTIKIVRTKKVSKSKERFLMDKAHRYLGDRINIKIEYLKAIPRENNGKFRQIVSKILSQSQPGISESSEKGN
jgi:phenylacetate-CoA ligase